jgi:hypothetical protein
MRLNVALLLLATSISLADETPQSAEMPIDFKVALFGDSSLSDDARAVFQLVKDEGASMVLHLGDFDSKNSPDRWEAMIDETLGPDFPFFAVIGNHDRKKWPEYRSNLESRVKRVGAECEGEIGVRAACVYKGLFFILSGVGIRGDDHATFIRDQLEATDATWRICAWHLGQRALQVTTKSDETGWEVYEACREGEAFVATGHAHTYSRTHLLTRFEDQVIAVTKEPLPLGDGASFGVVSGLGGRRMHRQVREDPWFASIYTEAQDAAHGALFCLFNAGGSRDRARCYFKDVEGRTPDRFTIVRE